MSRRKLLLEALALDFLLLFHQGKSNVFFFSNLNKNIIKRLKNNVLIFCYKNG
ncbi:hypothetical protein HLVA_12040 [Haliovirga abyssi]|uniref:Uncharacterized protein n=1 Tax=Haliovirga abyssi TaxID=2996794 RepID=A0AAU9DBJ7_9FUSO|nr:hypothetical protein HLVA_12040 [Haliovirga abyssi]